jgi:tartrate dehydrogenase/decarboxylase/D-malate dehydrogenase
VGRGIANPVATILSIGLMLDWLGIPEAGDTVRASVERVLTAPENATPDLGGKLTTSQLGEMIAAAV